MIFTLLGEFYNELKTIFPLFLEIVVSDFVTDDNPLSYDNHYFSSAIDISSVGVILIVRVKKGGEKK